MDSSSENVSSTCDLVTRLVESPNFYVALSFPIVATSSRLDSGGFPYLIPEIIAVHSNSGVIGMYENFVGYVSSCNSVG